MSIQENNVLKLQNPEFVENNNLGLPEDNNKIQHDTPSIKKENINTHNHYDNECFFLNILKKYFCCKNKSTPYSEEEKEKLVVQEEKEGSLIVQEENKTILVQEEEEEKIVVQEEKETLLVEEEIRIIFDDLMKVVEEH